MRARSDLWKSIIADGEFQLDTVVRIYGATGDDSEAVSGSDAIGAYKEYRTITSPVITRKLLGDEGISVGNCTIGTLNFSVLTVDTIPKSARLVVRSRPYRDTEYAEWMDFGTFWVDGRSVLDDLTTITAYDSMKMGYQPYSDDSVARVWPKSIKTVVTRIAEQMGVSIDSRTVAQVINTSTGDSEVVLLPGENDTLLDILGRIGGVIGGNWTMTPENELRYIPITTIPDDTNYIIDNGGNYNHISTESGNALIWELNEDDTPEDSDIDVVNVPVVIGSLTTAREYSISKVTMSFDDEHVYSYGDTTGYELLIENNPYATPGLCKALYDTVSGIVYAPFVASGACFDPAAELGDGVVIGDGIISIIFNETQTFDIVYRADISAPGEDETESEYPYKSALQRMKYELQESTNQMGRQLKSLISQTQTEIMQTVSEIYVNKDESDYIELSQYSRISQTAEEITLEVVKNFTTKEEGNQMRASIEINAEHIESKVEKNGVISAINQTAEQITIDAGKVNLNGYVTFTNLSTSGQTIIDGGNIKTNTITADRLTTTTQNYINGSNSGEQYIYISKTDGTTSVAANTTWVTNATGNQNTWTTKRPQYNTSYPVLFVAKQSQTIEQKNAGSTCSCTTPVIDETTTVIDGGKIITGSITAGKIAASTITGDKIAGNTITGDNIQANSINVSKITGSITSSTGSNNWGIDFANGSMNIGNIAANKITAGTLDASVVNIVDTHDEYWDAQLVTIKLKLEDSKIKFYNGNTLGGSLEYAKFTFDDANDSEQYIEEGPCLLTSSKSIQLYSNRYCLIRAGQIFVGGTTGSVYKGYTGALSTSTLSNFAVYKGIIYRKST